jgi:hypothetical protein
VDHDVVEVEQREGGDERADHAGRQQPRAIPTYALRPGRLAGNCGRVDRAGISHHVAGGGGALAALA